MRTRIVLTSARGVVLDARVVEPSEDAVEVAQDMLDEVGHLTVGDQLIVEEFE